MSRKVFISFLGFSDYGYCQYSKDGYTSEKVRFIQEATLEYLNTITPWTEEDVAMILLTKGAENRNWVDNGQTDKVTQLPKQQEGLLSRLMSLGLPLQIDPVKNLPDGNNEEEIWTIFERVFERIQDGDELYFDLTHGFRYLPMLALVLGNYAKFLKNVKVKHLSYGNFEGRDKKTEIAPIVDLVSLTDLQDWTFAAGQFLETGNAQRLVSLGSANVRSLIKKSGVTESVMAMKGFLSNLQKVVEERRTCRGLDIINSKNISSLKQASEKLQEDIIPAMKPVINEIRTSLEPFDGQENVRNGFEAARWCFANGLYQQAATILQEAFVSFFCLRHSIGVSDESRRGLINSAVYISIYNTPESKWEVEDEDKDDVREILTDDLLHNSSLLNAFGNLTEVRNDYNHSGMRSKKAPLKPEKIKQNISKCLDVIISILYPAQPC